MRTPYLSPRVAVAISVTAMCVSAFCAIYALSAYLDIRTRSRPDGYFRHPSVADAERFLNRVPLPPGSTLIRTEASPGQADMQTIVRRVYRVNDSDHVSPCVQLLRAVTGSSWTLTDSLWQTVSVATCTAGDAELYGWLAARDGGSVGVSWDDTTFALQASEGQMP